MKKQNRDFKGIWIPKEIWESKELSVMEKIFYVEIDSLDNDLGCFASNGYFSDFFNVSKQRCSQIINSLLKKGCIAVEYEREGKEIVKRTIRVSNKFNRVSNKSEEGIKKIITGYKENAKGNNTLNNTTNNNKNDKYEPFSKCFYNTLCDKVYLTYKIKEPNYAVWNNDFRLIIENDNVNIYDLKAVIKWVVNDDFWKYNIKSPAKLRKQFATLYNKMETKTGDKPHEWDTWK